MFQLSVAGACNGQAVLRTATGMVKVDNRTYTNDMSCQWLIQVETGKVQLTDILRPILAVTVLATLSVLTVSVERGSSVVECRTRNRESPGSNPRCYRFEVWAFSFTSRRLSRLSCINEYLAIDSGGNVSE